jgi:hypothetical protein
MLPQARDLAWSHRKWRDLKMYWLWSTHTGSSLVSLYCSILGSLFRSWTLDINPIRWKFVTSRNRKSCDRHLRVSQNVKVRVRLFRASAGVPGIFVIAVVRFRFRVFVETISNATRSLQYPHLESPKVLNSSTLLYMLVNYRSRNGHLP